MTYHHVKCSNFAKKDPLGALQSLQCKICGVVIADTVDRAVGFERTGGGQLTKVIRRQFTRFANYCEIKIAFEDPCYFHVTHGCSECLNIGLSPIALAEMHAADQEESPDGFTKREKAQIPIGVSDIKKDQSGII